MSVRIGGFTPLSSVDYPGRLSAVVFCQGCAWRCRYCHNPHLLAAGAGREDWSRIVDFLKRRVGLLDAVVFSGGEPTLQIGLGEAMAEVRALGFSVALHTAGIYPARLGRLLEQVDWVGFDVKAPFADYARVTGVAGSGEVVAESLARLVESGRPFEVRTTVDPRLLGAEEVKTLARELAASGVRHYVLQRCRVDTRPLAVPWLDALAQDIAPLFAQVTVRE